MHVVHPVPQRVHYELQGVGMADVEAVPCACGVEVELGVVRDEAVVSAVVDSLERQRRAEMIALGGVVVDDIEDHFDVGFVERANESLELLHLLADVAAARVLVVRGEEADRIVPPVVAQVAIAKARVLHELVDREELEGRDAERLEIVDGGRMSHACIRAAERLGHIRVRLRETLQVRLVDDGLVQSHVRRTVVAPVEVRVVDHRLRDVRGAVVVVPGAGIGEPVREACLSPIDGTLDGLRVRIDEQLVRVAAVALVGRPGAVDAVAVPLPGKGSGEVGVPAEGVHLLERDARLLALVEQA